jgi:hypothetical protein
MTKMQLARALAPFGIAPGTIRQGNATPKGYRKEQFREAWDRYLTPEDPSCAQEGDFDPQHRHNQGNSGARAENRAATPDDRMAEQTEPKSAENQPCGGVADQEPPSGGEGGGDGADAAWEGVL